MRSFDDLSSGLEVLEQEMRQTRCEGAVFASEERRSSADSIPTQLAAAADWYHERLGWSIIAVRRDKTSIPKWGRFQEQPSTRTDRSAWFSSYYKPAGLAVINGRVSGGLVCRDFDVPDSYERWKVANLDLAERLPTVRTPRGYHVYLLKGGYVQIKKIGDGEIRGAGYNVLPPSKLGDVGIYRWIIEPTRHNLVEIDDGPFFGLMRCWTERTEQTEETEQSEILKHTEITESDRSHKENKPFAGFKDREIGPAVQSIIDAALPDGEAQRNQKLFELARRLKAITEDAQVDPRSFKPIVKRWHELALPMIRTKQWAVTWVEFVNAFKSVKIAHGEDAVALAIERAERSGAPPEVPTSEAPDIKLLAAVCRELQVINGDGPFFLSCRSAEKFLNVPKTQAALMLKYLCIEGLIEEVEKGKLTRSGGRASRYRYRGALGSGQEHR